jgi:putative membrane protein
MNLIINFLGTVLAVLVAAYFVPGFVVANFYTAAIIAALLGIVGITLKPILFVLTLPINILTLGLFSFVINAGILLFLASFVDGFDIQGMFLAQFVAALLGGVVISFVQWVVHRVT